MRNQISFSYDGILPEVGEAVIESKKLSEAVLESIIGEHGVSPAAKRSLAVRLSGLWEEIDDKVTLTEAKVEAHAAAAAATEISG